MPPKQSRFSDDDDAGNFADGEGRECPLCGQEFNGVCPLRRADCPCANEGADEEDDPWGSGYDADDVEDEADAPDDDDH